MRKFVFLTLLVSLIILGCADAKNPVKTDNNTNGVLLEESRIALNGNPKMVTVGDKLVVIAEDYAGISIIDKETMERHWYTEFPGDEGSIVKLGRVRKLVLSEDVNKIFFYEEFEADNIKYLDISDISNPFLKVGFTGGTAGINEFSIETLDELIPDGFGGFYVMYGYLCSSLEVRPIAINQAGGLIQFSDNEDKYLFPSNNLTGQSITDDKVYVSAGQRGFYVADKNTKELLASHDTPGEALRLKVVGDYLYIVLRQQGVQVYNIADLSNISLVYYDDYDFGYAQRLSIEGNYLAVAAGGAGVVLYDISDKENIQKLETLDCGYVNDVSISNGKVYVADRDNGLLIYKINR